MGLFGSWGLSRKLRSPDRRERLAAIGECRQRPEAEALDLLATALADPDLEVMEAAAKAVVGFGSRAALDRLRGALENDLFALASTGGDGSRRTGDRVEAFVLALMPLGPAAADLYVRVLENRDAEVAAGRGRDSGSGAHRAAELLGSMRLVRAEGALVGRLADPYSAVRAWSAHALGEVGSSAAGARLRALLRDADEFVRARAAEALGKIRDREAVPDLEARLSDRSESVRKAASDALGALGWRPADPAQRAQAEAAVGDLRGAAREGASALRALLSRLWSAYGITDHRTNDVGGVSRQLKNRSERTEVRHLPAREDVEGILAALTEALARPGEARPRTELEMVAGLPDLRVRVEGQVERENYHSGATYQEDIQYAADLRCEDLRRRARALL